MIYNYINTIYSKKILFFVIMIIFYTIYSINNSNLSMKGTKVQLLERIFEAGLSELILPKDKNVNVSKNK